MADNLISLSEGLDRVISTDQLQEWARFDLRPQIPNAAVLITVGKLYGVGSIPTHRLSVDFPLDMIESLKNSAGALNDPLMYGWLRSGKLRYVDIGGMDECGDQRQWRSTLMRYGIRSMMIHGVLDHAARRFAVFQICNPHNGRSSQNVKLLSSVAGPMAVAAWRSIDNRTRTANRGLTGHPTLSLTPTELHIIELLAQGLSNKEIARRRGVSDSTIKTQVQRTGAKVGATRRAEIVAIAMPMLSPLPAQNLIDYEDI